MTDIKNIHHFNLAGIVPVDGQPLDFNFPWHDSLIPIGENYLAVEKAVFNCAVAGCDTIWIACSREMQPLIRYRLGDYVVDPIVYFNGAKFGSRPKTKEIPIYYVPTHPKNVDRRNSLPWSIITGAQAAWRVGLKLSRYTCPDKYFVSFPYGMFSPYYMTDFRARIRNNDSLFYVSHEEKSFLSGDYLPFTFTPDDFLKCRRKFRSNEIKPTNADGEKNDPKNVFNGRYFTHDFIFSEVDTTEVVICEVPWYYDVSNWQSLRTWLGSENFLKKPPEFILSARELNPLGETCLTS